MLPRKNRSLEVDNQKAQSAFDEGKEHFRKKDYRTAHSYFLVASAAGHSRSSRWLARTTELLQLGEAIDPESYDRNLAETNRPISTPTIARSLSITKEDAPQLMEVLHRTQRPRLSPVAKPPVAQQHAPAPAKKKKDKMQHYKELKKKATEGNPEAQYKLGLYYLKKAEKWLMKAAEQHHKKAERELSRLSKTTDEPPQPVAEPEQEPQQSVGSGATCAAVAPLLYEYRPEIPPAKESELTFRNICKLLRRYLLQNFLSFIRRKNRK